MEKTHKYTIGLKIDTLYTDLIETISVATFLDKTEKTPYVKHAVRKLDTLKIFLMILWENKSISHSGYAHISTHLDEIGRMLGGWYGQLKRSNEIQKTSQS